LGADTASDAGFSVYPTDGIGKEAFFDDLDGIPGAVQIAGLTTGADGGIDI
jgi:hypothetical protein